MLRSVCLSFGWCHGAWFHACRFRSPEYKVTLYRFPWWMIAALVKELINLFNSMSTLLGSLTAFESTLLRNVKDWCHFVGKNALTGSIVLVAFLLCFFFFSPVISIVGKCICMSMLGTR